MFDKNIVSNRDGYGISYGTGLRGDNMHKLKEKDVTMETEPTSDRPYLLINTDQTKTCKKRQQWIVPCECPYKQPHDSFNTECPISIHKIHTRLKYDDFMSYCNNKNVVYKELYYFRRLFWVSSSDHGQGNYFSTQRRGEAKIRKCMAFMADLAGVKFDSIGNHRRTQPTC